MCIISMVKRLAICSEAAESRRLSNLTLCPEEPRKIMESPVRDSSCCATDSHKPNMEETPALKTLGDMLRRFSRISFVMWLDRTCAALDADIVGTGSGIAAAADAVTANAKGDDGATGVAVGVRVDVGACSSAMARVDSSERLSMDMSSSCLRTWLHEVVGMPHVLIPEPGVAHGQGPRQLPRQ